MTVNQVTATLPNDKSGTKVEKIKSDLVPPWLRRLSQRSPEIFVQCLIPRPESGARVGGHWEIRAPDTVVRHNILLSKYIDSCWLFLLQVIKEGLTKLSCLLSFDIITLELWTQIAPHWLDTIVESYPRDQLAELSR